MPELQLFYEQSWVEATATTVVVKRTPLLPHPFLELCLGFSRIAPLPWQSWYRRGGGCGRLWCWWWLSWTSRKDPFSPHGSGSPKGKGVAKLLLPQCSVPLKLADSGWLPPLHTATTVAATKEPDWMTGVVQPRGHSADPDSPNPPNVSANQKAMLLWATAWARMSLKR